MGFENFSRTSAPIARNSMPLLLSAGLLTLALSACGGGGGGGSGTPPPQTAAVKYSLGGMMIGAVPQDVELDDGNGFTVKLVNGSTSFAFNNGQPYLNAGSAYSVKIKSQPKGYQCTTENNAGTINANIVDVRVKCSGLLTKTTYVMYVGDRDSTFGFQSLARDNAGNSFVSIAFELKRIDAAGIMHHPTLVDKTTGIQMSNLTVRNVAIGPTGFVYLSVTAGAETTKVLRLWKTATENVYLAETVAESYLGASNQRKNFGVSVGMSVDSNDNIFVADRTNKVVWKIANTGVVSVFAGSGVAGRNDGTGTAAAFEFSQYIHSMSHDANNNLYVEASFDGGVVRKITPEAVVTSIAAPVGYQKMVADAAGNLYFEVPASNGVPSILRLTAAGATEVLVSHGAVNLETTPNVLTDHAIGYVKAMRVADGYIYVAGDNPMALHRIKIQ